MTLSADSHSQPPASSSGSSASVVGDRSLSSRVLLAELFDEFAAVIQRGDETQIDQYLRNHPQFETELREFLPTIRAMVGMPTENLSQEITRKHARQRPQERRLGDFRLLREVGRGGMGVVYEAEQISIERTVALKILPFAAVIDPRHVQRFKNEVQAAALLQHQNIVPVYSVGSERGVHYYAMQFVAGRTLSDLIAELRSDASRTSRKGARPCSMHKKSASDCAGGSNGNKTVPPAASKPAADPPTFQTTADADSLAAFSSSRSSNRQSWFRAAAKLMIQAAEALEHAHNRGVLHRDIKPGNLMVDVTGNLWITDFGLARLDAESNVTMTGDVVGTLRYMSPEQAQGSNSIVDQRTDVYSLGSTMYELLALYPAFQETDRHRLLRQIGDEEPTRLRRHDPAIPKELETIVHKAMEKSPVDRYASAGRMAEDLRRFLDHRPILAKPPSAVERIRKWSQRHVGIVWTALAGSILLAMVLAIATWIVSSSRNEARTAEQVAHARLARARAAEQSAARAAAATQAAKLQSDALLYAADVRLAADGLVNGTVGRGVERLTRHIPKPGEIDRRGFAWYYVWNQLQPEVQTWEAHEALHCLRYSPLGEVLATGGQTGAAQLWDARSGELRGRLIFHDQIIRDLAFSPDAALLATASDDGSVGLWDVDQGQLLKSISIDPAGVMAVCFSRDGQTVFAASDFFVEAWPHPWQDAPHLELGPHPGQVYGLAVSADGSSLAVASGNDGKDHGAVTIWRIDQIGTTSPAAPERVLTCDSKCVAVRFSNAGRNLVAGMQDGQLTVWRTDGFDHLAQIKAHTSNVYDIAFSSDDRFMATASKEGTLRTWDTTTWQTVETYQSHEGRVYGVDFARHDALLASAGGDGKVKTWTPTAESFSLLPVSSHAAAFVAPSPDHRTVALGLLSRYSLIPQAQVGDCGAITPPAAAELAWYGSDRLVAYRKTSVACWPNASDGGYPNTRLHDADADGDFDRIGGIGQPRRMIWQEKLAAGFDVPRLRDNAFKDSFLHIDLKGDGNMHVITAGYDYGYLDVMDPRSPVLAHDVEEIKVSYPTCLDAADLDLDGRLDLLCTSRRPGSVLLLTQRASSDSQIPFAPPRPIAPLADASVVKAVHVAGHRAADVVAGSYSRKELVYLRNLGNGEFEIREKRSTAPVSPLVIDYVDADDDGQRDIVVAGPEGVQYARLGDEGFASECLPLSSLERAPWTRPLLPDVAIFDASSLEIMHQFHTGDEPLQTIAASRETRRIATVSKDHVIRLWDDQGSQLAALRTGDTRVKRICFCRNGSRLLAAVGDDILVYDHQLRVLRHLEGHQNTVSGFAIAHGNDLVATVSDDLTAKLWSLGTGELLKNLTGHTAHVKCASFSADDRLLATADRLGIVRVWDIHTGQELLELKDFPYSGEVGNGLSLSFQSPTKLTIWGAVGPGKVCHEGTWDVGDVQPGLTHP